eukprot:gene39847-48521_t
MEDVKEVSSPVDGSSNTENADSFVRLPKAEKKRLKEERRLAAARRRLMHRKEREREKEKERKAKRREKSTEEESCAKPSILKSDLVAKLQRGMESGQNICVDLSFEDQHIQKEKSSIASQLVLIYAFLKRADVSIHLSLCSMNPSSYVFDSLQKQGLDHWFVDKHSEGAEQIFPKDKLVYLSPDATEVLETIESDKVYVIGGIVDRSVKKNLTLDKAKLHGLRVARFPVQEYVPSRVTHILNIDTCVHIISYYLRYKDWERALREAIPQRKQQSRKREAAVIDGKESETGDLIPAVESRLSGEEDPLPK